VILEWQTLTFPREVTAETVTDLLRTLAAEPQGSPLTHRIPLVVETRLSKAAVSWRVGSSTLRLARLRVAADEAMPGIRFMENAREAVRPSRSVELRVVSGERLLATEQAEAAARRLLGMTSELRASESLVVRWQIGPSVARSPSRHRVPGISGVSGRC